MSTNYSKMSDFEINCMIAKILHTNFVQGAFPFINDGSVRLYGCDRCFDFNPCNNPADAWPIIDDNNITIINDNSSLRFAVSEVAAYFNGSNHIWSAHGNGLRAAMIVFLKMQESKNAS